MTYFEGDRPDHYRGKDFVIAHAHYDYPQAYLEGHIPGAIALNTSALEDPVTWNRRPPEELKKTLTAHGISADTTVVLCRKCAFPDNEDPLPRTKRRPPRSYALCCYSALCRRARCEDS
ncbi:MAG: hypothetical protein U5L09_05820 [Bacteroidales bacterium]|nr:hypothetical protein [Bacteroidales bacterium]